MRINGKISSWNDSKGYGFVVSQTDAAKAFVHISAFPAGSQRPTAGDSVTYSTTTDERGRINAVDVRFVGRTHPDKRMKRKFPRGLIGGAFLGGISAATFLGFALPALPLAYLVFSALSYIAYTLDKHWATKQLRRIPESTLHTFDLIGGWPGALVAQHQLRHKTAKTSFQIVFWLTVLLNVALVAYLWRNGWFSN
jgi:uncharacterized membrane protein YsdA (DUF1294 family)/cold shock CspA family protein